MARKRTDEQPTAREDCHAIVPCAFDGCPDPAILRKRLPTGWANLCDTHEVELVHAEAKRKFAELGLSRWPDESFLDWRKRVREYTRLMVKAGPFEEREERVA